MSNNIDLDAAVTSDARSEQASRAGAQANSFVRNAVVEQISALIDQRCALTIRRRTDPTDDANAAAD